MTTAERTLPEPMPIQEWINTIEIADKLYGKQAGVDQMIFVRDRVSRMMGTREEKAEVTVVSWHLSKSVKLPVYRVESPDGSLRLTLRDNFYNWKVSVETNRLLPDLFFDLFNKDEQINEVYCEGFEGGWVYGPFNADRSKFTIELYDQYQLITFLYLLSVAAGLR